MLCFMNSLEAKLERKLDDPRRDARAGDLSKCGRRELHVRIAELRVVKSIKELRAKFKRRILTWPAERKSLCDGKIEIALPRAIENSYPGVRWRFRSCECAGCASYCSGPTRRNREGRSASSAETRLRAGESEGLTKVNASERCPTRSYGRSGRQLSVCPGAAHP
jgi:hypothetical protein